MYDIIFLCLREERTVTCLILRIVNFLFYLKGSYNFLYNISGISEMNQMNQISGISEISEMNQMNQISDER